MSHTRRRSHFRFDTPKEWVRAGRTLVIINVIVLVVSCFTEHLWNCDFLHGGQDIELSVLAFLAFICLILVFAQYFRRKVSELLDRRSGPGLVDGLCDTSVGNAPLVSFLVERPPGPASGPARSLSSVMLRI